MPDYDAVTLERHGPVGLVTLNRPQSLNAFNAALRMDVLAAINEVNADPDLRIGVLTGAGRAFSAGADLTESAVGDFDVRVQLKEDYKPSLMAINEAPQPWISAVNGAAAGIGSAYAMGCDLTVMADNAFIYQAFTAIGLVPDGGATWHLIRVLGRKRAFELIATGEKLSAQRCLEWGLCNRVVPADALLDETINWAGELAQKAPLSLRHARQALDFAMQGTLADTIDVEADLQHLCVNSEDAREGALAFLEKRVPTFNGR